MKKLYKYGAFLPLLFAAIGAKELILRQFWFDESLTLLNFALLPAEKIYTSYAIPNNHILYTYLLHWHYLFAPAGIAEDIWCRLLSLVIAFGYLIFSWWSIKKRAHRILLCIFAASLPFALYATSVRGYIAALFFAAVTLHTACVFAGKGNVRSGLFYLLSSLGCVAVLPSNIAVCAATVIYAAPLCGKRFFAGKRFVFLSIIPIGAFVEYAPGKEGMVHISKLQKERTEKVEDVVNVGDTVRVKYLGTDEKGRQNLSMRDAAPKAE